MTASKDTLVRRSLRRFLLGSGPLKRRSDRLQAWCRCAVVLSFVVAPPLAVATANSTIAHLESLAAVQATERSLVRAVLLEEAPASAGSTTTGGEYSGAVTTVPVPAVWFPPGGSRQEGTVMAETGTPVGTALPVWVDRAGNVTSPPIEPAGIPGSAAAMAMLPLIGVPLLTWTLYTCVSLALDVHRERRWARDWAAVEPRWTSRSL